MGIFLLTLINWLLILVETEIKDWEHHTNANQGIETTTGSQDQISIGIMQDLICNVKLSKVTLVANYFYWCLRAVFKTKQIALTLI